MIHTMIGALEPGTYVVAVSGGVDSVALLDMLAKLSDDDHRFIVAHFDHGIRPESHLDRQLVQELAKRHGMQFVYDQGNLGIGASEEAARDARYAFLHKLREASRARAVITAHHRDDLLETAILNMLRGTGRRGLVSLRSRDNVLRPLLHVAKTDLVAYAKDQGLVWHEDSTNADMRYLRNYVRHSILPKFSDEQRQALLGHINKLHELHEQLETELTNHLHLHPGMSELDRYWFIMLPHAVAREIMLAWLRRHDIQDITSRTLERVVMAAKTYPANKQTDIDKKYVLHIEKNVLALRLRDR